MGAGSGARRLDRAQSAHGHHVRCGRRLERYSTQHHRPCRAWTSPMKTPITDMLGLELPLFAFSHCRDVVAEVSKAGGMGVLGAAGFSAELLEEELQLLDRHTQRPPYGVGPLIPHNPSHARGREPD